MELNKLFVKYLKRICVSMSEELLNNRLDGINVAEEAYDVPEKIVDLLKIYYRLPMEQETKEEFVECFYSIDKTFDEQNEEEICILAGCVLANILQDDDGLLPAFFVNVLGEFLDGPINELSELANRTIIEQTQEQKQFINPTLNNMEVGEEGSLFIDIGEFAPSDLEGAIDLIKQISISFNELVDYTNTLCAENAKCREKIQVLSWIIGEWSDWFKTPVSQIKDVEGALILGVELADLVETPGPLSAEAFLNRMIVKCEKTVDDISLTELIDSQSEDVRKGIVRKYGRTELMNNLPIFSALRASLTVDEKRAWLPAYRKACGIDPDGVRFSVVKWSKLTYLECMIAKLI